MCYNLLRKILFLFDPEDAHRLTLKGLRILSKVGITPLFIKSKIAPLTVMGLQFSNPVGLAAGLDKNAEYIEALSSLGFGFIEVGTITPKPQSGNPQPRLFRIPDTQALINRMGFNSRGLDYCVSQLNQTKYQGVLGISITANNATSKEDTVRDYRTSIRAVYPYASYITLDISCPNVANKAFTRQSEFVLVLLQAMKQEQLALNKEHHKYVPLAVKISPDMTHAELEELLTHILTAQMDGVIATNTTRTRPDDLEGYAIATEKGGLSGQPLFKKSLQTVEAAYNILQGKLPIIAVGGIMSADDAMKMFEAGANLVQIYTGLIYKGPRLISEIVDGYHKGLAS